MGLFDIFRKRKLTGQNIDSDHKENSSSLYSSPWQMKAKAKTLLKQATKYAELANHTANPKQFFEAYNDALQTMEKLKELEPYVPFTGRSPSAILAELQSMEQQNAAILAMVKRCIQQKRWASAQQAEHELAPYWDKIPHVARIEISLLTEHQSYSVSAGKANRESYESANNKQIAAFKRAFDLTTAEGIQAITLQAVQPWIKNAPGVPSHPVEILSKQASLYQKEHLDLAIECLRKANELRPVSGMVYSENSYLRLVRYLCKAERFEEAEREHKKIQAMFHGDDAPYSRESIANSVVNRSFFGAKELGTDLVEVSWVDICCETCGKYRGRIFSISGRDKRFPKFPSDFCHRCGLSVYPIIEGVSVPAHSDPEHMVEQAQRPLVDTRTPEQIEAYGKKCRDMQREQEQKENYIARERKDHEDYAWIRENLPDLMPKTFSGYRRMRTMNTANFQKLRAKALELGREI